MNKFYTYAAIILWFTFPLKSFSLDYFSSLSKEDFLLLAQNDLYSNKCQHTQQFMDLTRLNFEPEAAYFVATCIQNTSPHGAAALKAIELLEYSAKAGNADAAFQLSQSYSNGYGVDIDLLKAVDWSREFHNLSRAVTSYSKDVLLINGEDVQPSTELDLLRILETKAKSGNVESQYLYAQALDRGKLGRSSLSEAIYWYEKSADSGHEEANFILGYFYCRGISVAINKIKANSFLERSNRHINCP